MSQNRICACCGYETELKSYQGPPPESKLILYCHVCAYSLISISVTYPTLQRDNKAILQTIGFVTNLILDEIRKLKVK